MTIPEHDAARDARIRKWIEENSLELIRQSPLGVTLGLLVTGLSQIKTKDVRALTDEGLYYRCHRVLADMVEAKLIRKDGKQYFYLDPSERVMAGIEDLIDHAFPGARLKAKDLAPLRAALDGLVSQENKAITPTRKTRSKKPGSKIG